MTLVTALQGKDFVIAATDSRGTFGRPDVAFSAHDMMRKATIVAPHVVILNYGVGEVADNIVDEFQRKSDKPKDGITAILGEFQRHCLARWNEWFANIPFKHRPPIAYLVVGLDEKDGKYTVPKIYSLSSRMGFAPALHRYGWANGGIPIYAIYIYGRKYRSDMDIEELCGLAAYAISETATQDQRVGGPIRMIKILPSGAEELTEKEIDDALQHFIEK